MSVLPPGPQPPWVLLFAKAPQPGRVKTRLASDIGEERACQVYRWLAERQLGDLPAGWPVVVQYAPADAEAMMRQWLGRGRAVTLRPQADGDLGARLVAAVKEAFAADAPAVILLGTDCPGAGAAELEQARARLEAGADAVFGPTTDGGYYLLGLRALQPVLFEGIPWSTRVTLEVSLAHARGARLNVDILTTHEDVDDLAGLRRAIAAGTCPDFLAGQAPTPGNPT